MKLPLVPTEAFVYSKIDGEATVDEIEASTGLDEQLVAAALQRLVDLGAITWPGHPAASPDQTAPHASSPAPQPTRAATTQASPASITPDPGAVRAQRSDPSPDTRYKITSPSVPPAQQTHPAPDTSAPTGLYDPADLDEAVDLDDKTRRLVLDLYYQRDDLTYYELLGVSPHASKKEIKSAYYQLVTVFHTDNYFNKELGSFKPKMEKMFSLITTAEETLSRKMRRKAYNETLSREQIQRAERTALAKMAATPVQDANEPKAPPVRTLNDPSPSSQHEETSSGDDTTTRQVSSTPSSVPPITPNQPPVAPHSPADSQSRPAMIPPIPPPPVSGTAPTPSAWQKPETTSRSNGQMRRSIAEERLPPPPRTPGNDISRRSHSRSSQIPKTPSSRSSQIPITGSAHERKRQALGKKLRGRPSQVPPRRASVPPIKKGDHQAGENAMETLRMRHARTSAMTMAVNAENLELAGMEAMRQKHFDKAIIFLERALKLRPSDAQLKKLLQEARNKKEQDT